jgi:putative transposase
MDEYESNLHEMALQIPHHLHSQVPQKNDLRGIATASRTGVPQIGATEREPDRGGSSSRRSRAHLDFDSAEICGVAGGWLHQGECAIYLARVYSEKKRNFVGQHFWVRGYFVSMVGMDQEQIREYIKKQEAEDTRLEQLNLW